jgi:hypothetical protein
MRAEREEREPDMEPEARDRAGFKGVDMLDEEEGNG